MLKNSNVMSGQKLFFDVRPVVENGRILLLLRAVFDANGAQVDWDYSKMKLLSSWQIFIFMEESDIKILKDNVTIFERMVTVVLQHI